MTDDTKPKVRMIDPGVPMVGATDISSEVYREYNFGEGKVARIENPFRLKVSGGGHRVLDAQGVSHYIPKGWHHLSWQAREGEPAFVA